MSAQLTNNANGGTNGAAVTYYNSGEFSGDAWTYISLGAGTTATFTDAPARGGMSYRWTTGGTASQGFMEWGKFPQSPDMYVRFTAFLPALPAASFRPCELNDGINITLSIGINTAGKLSIRDSAGASMGVTGMSVPIGRWFRIEVRATSHATAGQMTVRLYSEVDSPYPAEKLTSAASFNTKPNAPYSYKARFGISSLSVANLTYYLDDIAISDSGYPGPADPTYTPLQLIVNTAETGSDGTAVTPGNSGNNVNTFTSVVFAPGSVTYSTAQVAHDTLSFLFQSSSGIENCLEWAYMASKKVAARCYIYLTALPPVTTDFLQLTTTDSGLFEYIGRVAVNPTGKVALYDNSGLLWTSTASLSISSWYRLELYGEIGLTSTSGTLQCAAYVLDNVSAIETYSTTSANTGTSVAIGMVRIGKGTATTMTSAFYMDGFAAEQQATGFLGPYTGPLLPAVPYAGIVPHLGWGRAA